MRLKRVYAYLLLFCLYLYFYHSALFLGLHNLKDSAYYIILAESVAKGQGLRAVNYPGSPFSFYCAPLLPFLLAPVIFFSGRNLFLMHFLVLIFSFSALIAIYNFFRLSFRKSVSLMLVFLIGVNWVFLRWSSEILTDVIFVFFVYLSFYFYEQFANRNNDALGVPLALSLIASFLSRYIGILLLAIVLISLFFGSRKKFTSVFIPVSLALSIWALYNFPGTNAFEPSFLSQLHELDSFWRLKFNIWLYQLYIPHLLIPPFDLRYNRFLYSAYLFIFLFIHWGWLMSFKYRHLVAGSIFYIVYFISLLFWPSFAGGRYFLPLFPLVFVYAYIAAKSIYHLRLFPRRASAKTVAAAVFGVLFGINWYYSYFIFLPQHRKMPEYDKDFIQANIWLSQNTSLRRQEVVGSNYPTIVYYFTGRKAVNVFCCGLDYFVSNIRKYNIKYIVVKLEPSFCREEVYPYLRRFREALRKIDCHRSACVYEITKFPER